MKDMSREHGTYAGRAQHQVRGEQPCAACRAAAAEYQRNRRAASTEAQHKDRWWNNTHAAAMTRLAQEYPDRFAEILAEIRAVTPTDW